MNLMNAIKSALKNVKIDQDGLNLITVNLKKDKEKSRLVLTATSEVGLDLPGDTMEDMLVSGFDAFTGDGTLGN